MEQAYIQANKNHTDEKNKKGTRKLYSKTKVTKEKTQKFNP